MRWWESVHHRAPARAIVIIGILRQGPIVAWQCARIVHPPEVFLKSFDKIWESRDPFGACEGEKSSASHFNK